MRNNFFTLMFLWCTLLVVILALTVTAAPSNLPPLSTKSLTARSGNWYAYGADGSPLPAADTAKELIGLLNRSNGCSYLAKFQNGGWKINALGIPVNNFPIVMGEGYVVYCQSDPLSLLNNYTDPKFIGIIGGTFRYKLNPGWNLITPVCNMTFQNGSVIDAPTFVDTINLSQGSCTAMAAYQQSTWKIYQRGLPFNAFSVEQGKSYMVLCNRALNFTIGCGVQNKDLAVDVIGPVPTVLPVSESTTLTVGVQNAGNVSLPVRMSTSFTFCPDDTHASCTGGGGSSSYGVLPAGIGQFLSNIVWCNQAGNFTFTYRVDPTNELQETNELNNNLTIRIRCEDGMVPDLASFIVTNATAAAIGETVSINATMINLGNRSANPFCYTQSYSFQKTDGSGSGAAGYTCGFPLSPGQQFPRFDSFTCTQEGTYTYGLFADPYNNLTEISELNNNQTITVRCFTPLKLSSYPEMFNESGRFNGLVVLAESASAADTIVAIDLLLNSTLLYDQRATFVLDSEVLDPFGLNLFVIGTPCVNRISAQLLGNPSLCTDWAGGLIGRITLFNHGANYQLVLGANEGPTYGRNLRILAQVLMNNTASGSDFKLTQEPDRIPDLASSVLANASSAIIGEMVSINAQITNTGNATAYPFCYISSLFFQKVSGEGSGAGGYTCSFPLVAGRSISVWDNVTCTEEGVYTYGIAADPYNNVSETNELNNDQTTTVRCTNQTISNTTYEDAVLGNSSALVLLTEFGDYQGPFCGRFFNETLPLIKQNYIDTGKVKFIFYDYPLSFYPNDQKAAEAAECAGEQSKYYEMQDLLFIHGVSGGVPAFKQYAQSLGLDTASFDICLDSGAMAHEIELDIHYGNALGVQGTPTFFVGSRQIDGSQPYSVFEQVLESALNSQKNMPSVDP
ncbi:thioredoxin domain-containing protein [Candidatus Woesearchaeota archaeon]|nr:thioredoxin domain-containing protein [Candidatus Woesearchaeota archaeon]